MKRQMRKNITKINVKDHTRQVYLDGRVSRFKKAYKMGYISFSENIFCP